MDGERLGPLSYDVTPPEGEASAQRPILLSGAVILALTIVSIVGGWIVLGQIASASLVIRGGPLLILAAGIGVAWATSRDGLPRTRRTALVTATAMALFAAFVTSNTLGNVKPAMPQVRHAVDGITLPPGFQLLTDESFGDRLCRRGCPAVERSFAAPENDPDPVATLILAMFDQGWERVADVEPRFATGARKDGLTAQLSENTPHVVELRVTRR